jgi:predicted peroxiredoxin
VSRAAISLTTGLEDPERVTVALLVAVSAAESGRSSHMFLTKEAVSPPRVSRPEWRAMGVRQSPN